MTTTGCISLTFTDASPIETIREELLSKVYTSIRERGVDRRYQWNEAGKAHGHGHEKRDGHGDPYSASSTTFNIEL